MFALFACATLLFFDDASPEVALFPIIAMGNSINHFRSLRSPINLNEVLGISVRHMAATFK